MQNMNFQMISEYNVSQFILPFLTTSKLRNSIVSVGSAVFSFYVVFNYKIEPLLEFNPDIINDVVTELFYKLQYSFESTFSAKARLGNNKAAIELMEKMTEQNAVLFHLGFTIGDTGRLRIRK